MKSTIKSIGMLIYFLVAQIAVTFGIIIFKLLTDEEWFNAVGDCIMQEGVLSATYFSLISELIIPTLIAADIIVVLPVLFIAFKKKEKIYQKLSVKSLVAYIGLGISLNLIVSGVVSSLPAQSTSEYDGLMQMVMTDNFFLTLVASGIIAPIVEEIIFRYCICNFYKSSKVAIFVSALAFGIAHMNLIQSSYAFVLGIILAWLYVKTRNLLVPTIVHLTINSTSVIYEYLPSILQNVALVVAGVVLLFQVVKVVKVITLKMKSQSKLINGQ